MESKKLNYFTCTLGQAAQWKQRQSGEQPVQFDTILELIEEQASELPERPALGFADFSSSGDTTNQKLSLVTFQELRSLSITAAETLAGIIGPSSQEKESQVIIGLMCMTSLDFILTWLGLMQLGYIVFLLAPQLDSAAIEHLCQTCSVNTIFVDDTSISRTTRFGVNIRIETIPYYTQLKEYPGVQSRLATIRHRTHDIAYIRHTSGTSSGLPKPIFQRHWGAVGVLPRLASKESSAPIATFTTTPLYHGGLADCFRAWTSGAMIWFFPESRFPITGANVQNAVRYAREKSSVPVAYFSSVPYVLQLVASEEDEGIRLLQSMGMVGVGGAALPVAIGDKLVANGINLVSRIGSAECGFLMTSHRDYRTDTEWQYLRCPIDDPDLLVFESRGDGLAELVVKPGWPLRAKTNRDDGSYATSDLYEAHSITPNAWRYHSRADAQIALAYGKKFDPSPIEGAILASTNILRDVLVVGAGKDYAGALLFIYPDVRSEADIIEALWPCIEKINHDIPSHARLSKSALVVIQTSEGREPLDKSSKGTILRHQAEERYAGAIEAIYMNRGRAPADQEQVLDDELPIRIATEFSRITGHEIDLDEDLYQQGVDSITCIQVRRFIAHTLLPETTPALPINIVYDSGTVNSLANHIKKFRHGDGRTGNLDGDDDVQIRSMWELVDKYKDFQTSSSWGAVKKDNNIVVLTGATGALGSHILHSLLENGEICKVYCLVRAPTPLAAYERICKGLSERGLVELQHPSSKYPDFNHRVVCVPFRLPDCDLGLSDEIRRRISEEAMLFIHAAWAVNFSLRLRSFDDYLSGMSNLINFSIRAGARFCFISSTAAVFNTPREKVAEVISSDPMDASPLGYARSKWVAEQICSSAFDAFYSVTITTEPAAAAEGSVGESPYPPPPISIIRVGQLCGNKAGVWNASEAYPLMLSTAKITGCLPDLEDTPLNWLRVDLAAKSVLEIVLSDNFKGVSVSQDSRESRGSDNTLPGGSLSSEVPVYHVLNPHKTPNWHEMLKWIREAGHGYEEFDIVAPQIWLQKLEAALNVRGQEHLSQSLLGFWKAKYSRETTDRKLQDRTTIYSHEVVSTGRLFELSRTKLMSRTISHLEPLDRRAVLQMWNWIDENIGR